MTTTRSRRRRGKALIALLATTAALSGGAQALTPAPAAAMDGEDSSSECLPLAELPGLGWNGEEFCSLNNGSGGGGGSGGESGEGSGGGEVIVVVDPYKPPVCTAKTCLPPQPGRPPKPTPDDDGWRALEKLARVEAKASRELRELERKRMEAQLFRARREICRRIKRTEQGIRGEWLDGVFIRKLRGGSKQDRLRGLAEDWQREGCGRSRK